MTLMEKVTGFGKGLVNGSKAMVKEVKEGMETPEVPAAALLGGDESSTAYTTQLMELASQLRLDEDDNDVKTVTISKRNARILSELVKLNDAYYAELRAEPEHERIC